MKKKIIHLTPFGPVVLIWSVCHDVVITSYAIRDGVINKFTFSEGR
jgi:hypothetical protein